MAEGSLSLDTRVVMPSVTLPNWTSHLCGSGPEQHGVVDNSWEISKFVLPAIETDSKGYYPSVFKVLKEALPQAKTPSTQIPSSDIKTIRFAVGAFTLAVTADTGWVMEAVPNATAPASPFLKKFLLEFFIFSMLCL